MITIALIFTLVAAGVINTVENAYKAHDEFAEDLPVSTDEPSI